MTRSGHVVDERFSCARSLYVNRDLRRVWDSGEEAWKGCDEDIVSRVDDGAARASREPRVLSVLYNVPYQPTLSNIGVFDRVLDDAPFAYLIQF